jgi:NAD(P)-dependent dehydrogenase (short-subunit alcohol dehydrogenase family)
MTHWKGATAIVTGGGSGIGKALSLAMAKRGAHVLVTDINADAAAQVAAACGDGASAQALDVRDAAAVQACVDGFVNTHGKLDYFFNNAGMGVAGEVYEIALEAWDRVIDVNIRGVVHGVAAAYPVMVKQKSGHIINTASLAGLGPAPLLTPYAATKHAVVGLSTSLRIEAKAHNVRVTVLCPSAIETPLLDAQNPPDLPPIAWYPNIRNYLTRLAGPPYPVEQFAEESLAAIERDEAVVVLPKKARFVWRLGRALPKVIEAGCARAVAAARKKRP